VRTRLRKADGETVRLDYLLRQFDSQWLIIDVLAKGSYSELATRRSEYISVLKREGFEGLIAKLDRKVAELMQKSATR
jgi:phospholipid transport system substrate-binding protein